MLETTHSDHFGKLDNFMVHLKEISNSKKGFDHLENLLNKLSNNLNKIVSSNVTNTIIYLIFEIELIIYILKHTRIEKDNLINFESDIKKLHNLYLDLLKTIFNTSLLKLHKSLESELESTNLVNYLSENNDRGKNKNKKMKNGKKTKCQPWQTCWLKENPYNPLEDVQNIYYNFHGKCSSILQAMNGGCDIHSPVFSLPPPQGF